MKNSENEGPGGMYPFPLTSEYKILLAVKAKTEEPV
jgi:hypothetical protein